MASEFFSYDAAKCVACGQCVRDCSFKALKADATGRPVLPNPTKCAHCQHCFAICPTGAIMFDGKTADGSVATANLELPSAQAVENWFRVRRSTRQFQDVDVDPQTLDRVLRTLGNVPTGCNARSLTFTCYRDRASLARFKREFLRTIEQHRDGTKLLPRWLAVPAIKLRRGGEDTFFRGAAGMLIVSSDETNPAVVTPEVDVVAACTYFEMLAQAHGIATCWFGFLRMIQKAVVPELLEKTAGIRRTTPFYAMLFGTSAVHYARGVQRDDAARVVYPY